MLTTWFVPSGVGVRLDTNLRPGDCTAVTRGRHGRSGRTRAGDRYAPPVAPSERDRSSAALELGILGPLEIRCGGRLVELRRDKERTLLAMLALRVNEVVSLDHLASGLWEDAGAPRPPATLRVHVSRLRQALAAAGAAADKLVVTTARGYTLEVPAEAIDACRFEHLAAEGRQQLSDDPVAAAQTLTRALELWRGPILSDVSLSTVTEPELARLEEERSAVVEDRIDADLRCGRHRELIGELEQLVSEYPLRERLWGQLIVALYRSDRQADALRKYEDLRHLLGEELGVLPSPSLQQLERAILDHDPILGPPPVAREPSTVMIDVTAAEPLAVRLPHRLVPQGLMPFSGRRAQIDALLETWKLCVAGDRRVVLVSGEAGVGKTRLAAELARHADDTGGVVLFGRCDEDLGMPFQPFVEALEQVVQAGITADDLGRHAGELVRLLPDLARRVSGLDPPLQADPDTELYRLFDAIVGWLAAMSSDRGVLLVLDDLHWADKPTLLLLRHLACSAEPMRLLVVGTYRDTDIAAGHVLSDALADLRREPCVDRLALSGLDAAEVEEMVANAERDATDERLAELAHAVWSETDGNPFFVQEILRNVIESDGTLGRDGTIAVPEGVREVIGRRLTRLSAAANEVLCLASVVGEVVDFEVLVAVSELDEDAVLDALDEATAAALLRESSSGAYEFTHAIVRSTLYEDLSGPRRARRHRQVGEALEALGSNDVAALAHHFRLAGGKDARAMEYAAAAGEQALVQLAFDRAVTYYAHAVETSVGLATEPARRCELLIRLGTSQRLAGEPAFRASLLGAAALAQEIGNDRLLAKAVLANSRGFASAAGALDRERVELIEAAVSASGSSDSVVRACLLSLLALETMWQDPGAKRIELADEAVAMARRLGDAACLLEVSMDAQVTCAVPDRVPELVREIPGLFALAERVGDVQQLAAVCFGSAAHCVEMGALDEADRLIERVGQLAADLENPLFRWMAAHQRCRSLTVTGTGDEIEEAALAALEDRGGLRPTRSRGLVRAAALRRALVARSVGRDRRAHSWCCRRPLRLARVARDACARITVGSRARRGGRARGRTDGRPGARAPERHRVDDGPLGARRSRGRRRHGCAGEPRVRALGSLCRSGSVPLQRGPARGEPLARRAGRARRSCRTS